MANISNVDILVKETSNPVMEENEDSSDCAGGNQVKCNLDSPATAMAVFVEDDNASRDSFADFTVDLPTPNTPSTPPVLTPTTSRPSTPLRMKNGRFAPSKPVILNRVSSELSMSGHESGDDAAYAGCLHEYQWPKGAGDLYILQEQVSKYLGVLSFKRKYPDIYRRSVDAEEKQFLLDNKIVSNMVADMGITALRLDEVHALMSSDYPEKYEQYAKIFEEKRRKALSEKIKQRPVKTSKEKIEQMRKRAIKSATEFNKRFNKERKVERRYCFDLQSYLIHQPRKPVELAKDESGNVCASGSSSLYPVAVIPNQYQDYYKSYTSEELLALPLNSVLKEPTQVEQGVKLDDEYGEYYSDSGESEISELSIDSNISDSMFEEVAQFAFASPAAKHIQLTERQKQLLQEQQSKQQQQMFEQEQRHKHQQEQREKYKKGDQCKSDQPESKFHKWLKERDLHIGSQAISETQESCKDKDSSTEVPSQLVTREVQAAEVKPTATSAVSQTNSSVTSAPSDESAAAVATATVGTVCKICSQGDVDDGVFVHCSFCRKTGHAKCLDITSEMLPIVLSYPWQCMDCKTCVHCMEPHHEDKMIFCDMCDRGFHTFCIGLRSIPTGRWVCSTCGICNSCGARQPGGGSAGGGAGTTDSKATGTTAPWQHLYTDSKDGVPPQFLTTLCTTCTKLWDRGHFCPICLQCFDDTSPQFTPMVCCDCCDRWIHPDCDNIDAMTFRTFSEHGQAYKCAICRGEKVERYDKFHRKHRIQRYVEQSLKSTKVKKGSKTTDPA